MARYVKKGTPTLQDYRDSGALAVKPVAPSWVVRTKSGHQFCTTASEETAIKWAESIGGTHEWYIPVQTQKYDHLRGADHD